MKQNFMAIVMEVISNGIKGDFDSAANLFLSLNMTEEKTLEAANRVMGAIALLVRILPTVDTLPVESKNKVMMELIALTVEDIVEL